MQFGGWGLIFWALAGFACVCGVAVGIDLPETHPPSRRNRDSVVTICGRYVTMIGDARFIGYAAPVSLALGLIFAYVASAPSLFMQYFDLTSTAFSLIFAANAVGLIGAAQVNRWLTRHYDTHVILRGASLVNASAALLLPVLAWSGAGGFPAFLADIFVCLATVGLILPNATAAVMAPFPERAGVASALLGTLQFTIGAACGSHRRDFPRWDASPHGYHDGRMCHGLRDHHPRHRAGERPHDRGRFEGTGGRQPCNLGESFSGLIDRNG